MKKKLALVFLAITLVLILLGVVNRNLTKDKNITILTKDENKITLRFKFSNESLFLRAKKWGISGNHEEIVLSEIDTNLTNKEVDYIFYTTEIFYKIDENDKLTIYAPASSISEPSKGFSVIINIIELNTADEIKDYNINYLKYGLKRISVY